MLNSIDLNMEAVLNGKWAYLKCSKFKIACAQNRHFKQSILDSKLNDSINADAIISAMSKTILLDWEQLYDLDGNLIPYTVENAARVLLNNPEIYKFISDYSADIRNYLN